jgi:ankyrin repeat protein
VAMGSLGIVELLLERGADIQTLNDEDDTPYELSLQYGFRKIADLLWDSSFFMGYVMSD